MRMLSEMSRPGAAMCCRIPLTQGTQCSLALLDGGRMAGARDGQGWGWGVSKPAQSFNLGRWKVSEDDMMRTEQQCGYLFKVTM